MLLFVVVIVLVPVNITGHENFKGLAPVTVMLAPILITPPLLQFKSFNGLNSVPTAPPNEIAPPVVVPEVLPAISFNE